MTDQDLMDIYDKVNELNPYTGSLLATVDILSAMRAAIAVEREACALICDQHQFEAPHESGGGGVCADSIRARK